MSGSGLVAVLLVDIGDEEWVARVPGGIDTFLAALPAATAVDVYAVLPGGRRLVGLGHVASWTLLGAAHAEVGDR